MPRHWIHSSCCNCDVTTSSTDSSTWIVHSSCGNYGPYIPSYNVAYAHPETEEEKRARLEEAKKAIRQAHKEECREAFRRPPKNCGRGKLIKKWDSKKPRRRRNCP